VLTEDVVIPARSQLNVTTKAILEDISNAESHPETWGTEAQEIQSGLLVPRVLLPNRLSNLPVQILNTTDKPIQLGKDSTVSQLIPLVVTNTQVYEDKKASEQKTEESIIEDMISQVDTSVSGVVKEELKKMLYKYSTVFSKSDYDLGWTDLVRHNVDTGSHPPFRQSLRRYPPAHLKVIDDHLHDMQQQGVIEPACSPWASNIVLAKKKDGTFRCCVDYRRKDAYPLPRTETCLDVLAGSTLFSTFDLLSGYHQVAMYQSHSDKTAFVTRRGLFKFKTMPFGLTNAVATFQRLMDLVLAGLNLNICLAYLDDIILFSKNAEEHLQRLELLLQRLSSANLKLKPSKCSLLQTRVSFLGHIMSGEGIATDPQKTELINNWPVPKTVKELRGFLGLAGYYRKFVKDYSKVATPLNALLKKNSPFLWTEECREALEELKKRLQTPPILTLPNEHDVFMLDTDASEESIGSVLSQVQDGEEKVVAYSGRTLTAGERNYCIYRKELHAVVYFVKQFRQYLLG